MAKTSILDLNKYNKLTFKGDEIILDSSSPVLMLKSILQQREVPAE